MGNAHRLDGNGRLRRIPGDRAYQEQIYREVERRWLYQRNSFSISEMNESIVPSKGALGESQMEATEQEESELGV
jgi:hypothetical protein